MPDPYLDSRLEPHVQEYGRAFRAGDKEAERRLRRMVEDLVQEPLEHAYRATHHALEIMNRIPEAPSVESRWETDLREWGAYARRCSRGIPRFARRHDALRAAKLLETWSRAAEDVEIQEAFDDPLVMAEHDANGLCISGHVTDVDLDNREVKRGNTNRTQVPLVRMVSASAPQLVEGDEVVWTADRRVEGEIRSIGARKSGWEVEIAVLGGHKSGERLPRSRSEAIFVALSSFGGPPPTSPDEVPWTHRIGPSAPLEGDDLTGTTDEGGVGDAEIVAADTEDETGPDLRPEEVVAPPEAAPESGEIPGVLL